MARFDFNSFPDRFAIEARALQLRSEEFRRLSHAVENWLRARSGEAASRVNRWVGTQASDTRSPFLR
jgi:hypothetical protein